MPPASGPSFAAASACDLPVASRTAASTRSAMSPSGIIAVLLVSSGHHTRGVPGRRASTRRPPSLCALLLLGDDLSAEVTGQQLGVRLRRLLQVAVLTGGRRVPLVVGPAARGSLPGG